MLGGQSWHTIRSAALGSIEDFDQSEASNHATSGLRQPTSQYFVYLGELIKVIS